MKIEYSPKSFSAWNAAYNFLTPFGYAIAGAIIGDWLDNGERIVFWMILGVLICIALKLRSPN